MIRFLWTAVLVGGLLLLAAFHTEHFMGCLLCGTALVVVFQLQSLSDEQSRNSLVMQGIFSLLFSFFAGHFTAYLIFYELRYYRNGYVGKVRTEQEGQSERRKEELSGLRVCLPGVFCFVVELVSDKLKGTVIAEALPLVIGKVLLVTALSGLFFAVEQTVRHYLRTQGENAVAVQGAAVNELTEKKLNQELRMKNYLAERNARLEERENISRNIHNSVGHTITAAVMTLDAAELLLEVDAEKAKERVVTAKERMREGLGAIRCAVRVLDKENHAVHMEDFLSELAAVADNFVMDTELEVRTNVNVTPDVPTIPNIHTEFLNGAVQELLTNGVKHGKATRFLLSVTADSAHLQVSVKDNGTGDFSEENRETKIREGFGLKKIVSYVKKCGGSAKFINENGFCAMLTIPLYQEEEDGEM